MPQLPHWLAGNHRRQAIVAGAAASLLLIVIIGSLAAAGVFSGGDDSGNPGDTARTTTPGATRSPTPPPTEPTLLNGRLVYPDELAKIEARLPLAIMFDNFVDARPQIGLDQADLVFEAVAEGGITRFVATFWSRAPGPVEPVRSARTYYLDWAAELDAIYVNWGFAKSPVEAVDVPSALSRLGLRNFDGFYMGAPYFTRDPDRVGPHDGIAHTNPMWQLAKERGWTGPPQIEPWRFKEDKPKRARAEGAPVAPQIDLGFGGTLSSSYSVHWDYDRKTNGYLRSQGGLPHKDGRSRKQIEARNVVVKVTSVRLAGDGTAHLLYDDIGSGEAVVFQDGIAIPGSWNKPDAASRTRFFDSDGKEIAFNRGLTWIEMLSYADPLVY